jgi:hypothetical protein
VGPVVAILAAFAVLGWTRPALDPASAESDGHRSREVVLETRTATSDALSVFAPTTASQGAPVRERRLATIAGSTIVAVRANGLVCLELRRGGATSGACRVVAGFRVTGLELPFPTGSGDVGEVRWFPDGRLRLSLPG